MRILSNLILTYQHSNKIMEAQTVALILSIAGGTISLLLIIIGFFLSRLVSDVKSNTSEIGKNKGRIELVEQQQINDTKRIEELTQLELRVMSKSVTDLSNNVNTLVTALAKKGIQSSIKKES